MKEERFDVAIVSNDFTDLIAAAKLSINGVKVLMINQNSKNENTNFYNRNIRQLNGLDVFDLKTKIFKELKIIKNLNISRASEVYRCIGSNFDITLSSDFNQRIETLSFIFPDEKKGIKIFFDEIEKAREKHFLSKRRVMFQESIFKMKVNSSGAFSNKSLGEFLDLIIKDEKLKLILIGNIWNYQTNPYLLSFQKFAIEQSGYLKGFYSIQNENQNLLDYLSKIIVQNNGKIEFNCKNIEFLTEKNKLSAINYFTEDTLGKKHTQSIKYAICCEEMKNIKYATNYLCFNKSENTSLCEGDFITSYLYITFNEKIKGILKSKNYLTSYIDEIDEIKNLTKKIKNINDYQTIPFAFANLNINAKLHNSQNYSAVIYYTDSNSFWKQVPKAKEETYKKKIQNIFINRIEKHIPEIKDCIKSIALKTQKQKNNYKSEPTEVKEKKTYKSKSYRKLVKTSYLKGLFVSQPSIAIEDNLTAKILASDYAASLILKKLNKPDLLKGLKFRKKSKV